MTPYTTSLEVGHTTTKVQNGQTSTVFEVTTTTITITLTAITTDKFPMSNVNMTSSTSTFVITPSIDLGPVVVTLTNPDGITSTRNLTLPPWPAIVSGPPENWNSTSQSGSTFTTTRTLTPGETLDPTTLPDYPQTGTLEPNPGRDDPTMPPVTHVCPPNTLYLENWEATITLRDCNGPTTLDWYCPPTTTISIPETTTVSFRLGCTLWTGTTTFEELPVYTSWPEGELELIEDDPGDDDDGSHCDLWFFSVSKDR